MLMRGVQLLQRRHHQIGRAFSQCSPSVRQDTLQAWNRHDGDIFKAQMWKWPGGCFSIRRKSEGSDSKNEDVDVAGNLKLIQPKEVPSIKQTKNFEVKTTKGILTISTTIEDSKINEIVFEKSDLPPVAKAATSTAAVTDSKPLILAPSPEEKSPEKTSVTPAQPLAPSIEVPPPAPTPTPTPTPKRPRFDYRASLERNFVTPSRAISDFLLTATDLESLPKIKRRSPYEQEPPMTVYWRRDVEAKALAVWGSKESILRERLKREVERKQYQQSEC